MKRQYLQPQTYSVAQVCHNCIMGNSPHGGIGLDGGNDHDPNDNPTFVSGRLYR